MNGEEQHLFSFVETVVFSKQLDELASMETLYAIQSDLMADPERWPVIKGTNGARKGRIADPTISKGKSSVFDTSTCILRIELGFICCVYSEKKIRLI